MTPLDPWDVKHIEAQAPDDKSIPAARQVLKKGGFERIESRADGTGWWAKCQGLTDVYNVTATRGPTGTVQSGCTCPSPKRPCKHALALLLHLAAHPELRPELKAADTRTADQLEGLIAAVFAAPDDDLPRLVLADWLEENGEADRSALIRVSCELAKKRLPAGRKKALQTEEKRLTTAALGDVLKLLPRNTTHEVRRGFLWLTLVGHQLPAPTAMPATLLRLFVGGSVESLTLQVFLPEIALGLVRNVRRLDLTNAIFPDDILVTLAADLRPGSDGVRLKEVVLAPGPRQRYRHLLAGGGPPVSRLQDPTAARVRALAAERRFRSVETLTVVGGDDDAIAALAEVPDLKSLEWLILGNTAVTSAGLIALGNSKHLRRVTQLSVEGGPLTDDDFDRVSSEAAFPALTELSLRRLRLTDAGLDALARESGAFARVDDLTLEDVPVSAAGLRRLVVDSAALTRLDVDGLLPASDLLLLLFARTDRPMNITAGGIGVEWGPERGGHLLFGSGDGWPVGFFTAVAKWPKGLRVDHLLIDNDDFADGAFAELLDFLALGRIPRVTISHCGLRNADAVALAERLPELGITHLDLSENKIGMTGAKALAGSPGLASVVSLDLRGNPILKSGRAALVASPYKGALKEINLGGERVTAAEVKELRKAFGKGVKVMIRA